ncbi:MAG: hypothetical protein N4A50_05140 [Vallitalea sp.]|nr:hypothetical protein [Vallitalea sp.]
MTKNEIINYIKVGRAKSVCVDIRLVDNYPGYVREIVIMEESILKIEFNIYDFDEGGLVIEIIYDDFDKMICKIEEYIGLYIEDWKNVNKTGWYPELKEKVDFKQSGLILKQDLVTKNLLLPLGGVQYEIRCGYWRDLADGKITI